MAQKPYFHIFDFFSEQRADGPSCYARGLPKPRLSKIVQIMLKLHLQAFWQNIKYEKMQKFGFCLQDL